MRKLSTYSIFLLLVTLCFSCVKEEDITENDPEIIHQEGENRTISGIVKDTSGSFLPQASVKIILGELELETKADEKGEWNIEVPNSLTDGYIVANKVAYSKSIHQLNETTDNRVEDIYLALDPSNNELDLSFNPGNLKIVIGRMVDVNADPIPDVLVFLVSRLEGPDDEFDFNGFVSTRSDGSFEIVYEDLGFESTTLYAIFGGACSDVVSVSIQGIGPIEDLNDIELSYDSYSIFDTTLESDGTSCYDNVKTIGYYFALNTASTPIIYDHPLGDISLEYCPVSHGAFYVGVESDDNTHFNGSFFPHTETKPSYQFDICTPNAGNFLELSINGNVELYEDNLSFLAPRSVMSTDPNTPLIFEILSWTTFWPTGATDPAYQIGEFKSLSLLGDLEVLYNTVDNGRPFNHVNIVQDDDIFFAGVGRAKLLANDGSEVDIALRFRVEK